MPKEAVPAPCQFPVIKRTEPLYLDSVLIIDTKTTWRLVVEERRGASASTIHVSISGNYEPLDSYTSMCLQVVNCQSKEAYASQSSAWMKQEHLEPSWRAYRVETTDLPKNLQSTVYSVILCKPAKWGTNMKPVRFYFRGTYSNMNEIWETISSNAIILNDSSAKSYEKAFLVLNLVDLGYDSNIINKPDNKIQWIHFLKIIDNHALGVTGSKRKISDRVCNLTLLHLDSIMRMVHCEENRVTIKRLVFFCCYAQEGGVPPPLVQIEATINRYKSSWENGIIFGIMSSDVCKQYLLQQGFPAGTFILRMQYNSPREVCASSTQIHPQTGAAFVDHLTIPEKTAPNDMRLMDYLGNSPIHQVILPNRQQIVPVRTTVRNSPMDINNADLADSYRSSDGQMLRTNQMLKEISRSQHEPFLPLIDNGPPVFDFKKREEPEGLSEFDHLNIDLDPKVLLWLRDVLGDPQLLLEIAQAFADARVTPSSIFMLDSDDLKEMDVALGPRKLILRALDTLRKQKFKDNVAASL